MADFITGANEKDTHLTGVNQGRDFTVETFADLRQAVAGDPCPRCEGRLEGWRGIEVGHVFKLGTKYSAALNATVLDEQGQDRPLFMGCYGIGVGRTVAAAIEQNHDENGIIFPMPIAPFQILVTMLNPNDEEVRTASENALRGAAGAGVEALLDDRDERPGSKFKDADLHRYSSAGYRRRPWPQGGSGGAAGTPSGERIMLPLAEAAARLLRRRGLRRSAADCLPATLLRRKSPGHSGCLPPATIAS